tara:strand:+ start:4786 stop:5028 length:243 start_codon:yes stop_codon:yes gene_type:complete
MNLLKPSDIAVAATDISRFPTTTDLSDNDKQKILEMVRDYYIDKNEHIIDQYLSTLAQRTIDRYFPQTGFEQNEHDDGDV